MDEHLLPEEYDVGNPWRAPWDACARSEAPAPRRRRVGLGGVLAALLAVTGGWLGFGPDGNDSRASGTDADAVAMPEGNSR